MAQAGEIVVEIAGVVPGSKYRVKSYPILTLDGNGGTQYYEVPLYWIYVWKAKNHLDPATYTGKEEFKAVRFGVYDNDGSVPEYKAKGMFVVGLAEDRWYKMNQYIDYRLHSRPDNPDNGAFVIEGTHYIHSGPSSVDDPGYGTAGCVEIFGSREFIRFGDVLMKYSGAGSRKAVPQSASVWIHVKNVVRPDITPVP